MAASQWRLTDGFEKNGAKGALEVISEALFDVEDALSVHII
jgi:hypothetical protein